MTVLGLPRLRAWPSPPLALAAGILALLGGVLLAGLPLVWAAILLLVGLVVALTWVDPLYGVGAVIFFGPFKPLTEYYAPSFPLDLGQWFLFFTLVAWAARRVAKREPLLARSPLTFPLGLFIFLAALSLAGTRSFTLGMQELVKWLELLALVWLVVQVAGVERWRWVVGLVLATAVFQAGVGVWQFFRDRGPDHFLIVDGLFYRAYGTFEQPNPYGGFIGLCLPLAAGVFIGALDGWLARARDLTRAALERGRAGLAERVVPLLNVRLVGVVLAGLLAGLLASALVMSWSRGAWLGAGVAALAILFAGPRRARLGALLVALAVLAGLTVWERGLLPDEATEQVVSMTEYFQSFDVRGADINPDSYSVIERLAHWQTAVAMARDNPWLGVGIGNYAEAYPDYAFPNWPLALGHAHNTYLNVLAEVGLLGLAAYVVLWVVVLVLTFRLTRREGWLRGIAIGLLGAWVHFGVHSAFDSLWVSNLFLTVGALLGVLSVLVRMERAGAVEP